MAVVSGEFMANSIKSAGGAAMLLSLTQTLYDEGIVKDCLLYTSPSPRDA